MKKNGIANRFRSLASLAALCGLVTAPFTAAQAQTVHGPEQEYSYASVRGWTVTSLDERNGVHGCRATIVQRGRSLMIERYHGQWNLVVQSRQSGTFQGGTVTIDKAVTDAQFGLRNGYAIFGMSNSTLGQLKKGSAISVKVNGDNPVSFSLRGSTAAIGKVTECDQRQGEVPQAATPQAPATSGPAIGETATANCSTVTEGNYPCVATNMKPETGYEGVIRVVPAAGQKGKNAFFVKFKPGVPLADVWFNTPGGTWQMLGGWDLRPAGQDGFCATPAANQTAAARNALGQDAWELCVQ